MRALAGRAAVAVFGTGLFLSSLRGKLVVDDYAALRDHPAVHARFSFEGIFLREFWGSPLGRQLGVYRPITTLGFWIDAHLAGGAPWIFHATNLVLFGALLWVTDAFLSRWVPKELPQIARWLVLSAFAAMTIHVDVVPSIVGRAELLAALFSVLAIDAATDVSRGARAEVTATLRMVVFVLLAQLSKESALPLPFFCAWLAMRRDAPKRASVLRAGLALAALSAMLAFRGTHGLLRPTRSNWGLENPMIGQSAIVRLQGAFDVLARYVSHVLAPIDLCPDYGYSAIHVDWPHIVAGLALFSLALLGFLASLRSRPRLADALAGFATSYVAVSHLLFAASAVMADRLFFFPSLWVAIAVGMLLVEVSRSSVARARLLAVSGASFVLLQGTMTLLLTPTRRDQSTLGQYAVRACPNVARIREYRADGAHETRDPFEAAWALLIQKLIEQRFPAPVLEDEFPADWEDQPLDRRLELLRGRIDVSELRRGASAARKAALAKGANNAAMVLEAWTRMP